MGGEFVDISRSRCQVGEKRETLFIVGDSHAGAYRRMGSWLATRNGLSVKIYSFPACKFLSLLEKKPTEPACERFNRGVLTELRQSARAGDRILVAGHYDSPIFADWGGIDELKSYPSRAPKSWPEVPDFSRLVEVSSSQFSEFELKGVRLIFELPKPAQAVAAFRCADKYLAGNPVCNYQSVERSVFEARTAVARQYVGAVAAEVGGQIWDPAATLCGKGVCSLFSNGKPLYFDSHHLSAYGNDLLLDSFAQIIR